MTRKILVALMVCILLPAACLAAANGRQYGLSVGALTASTTSDEGAATSGSSFVLSGLMSIDDNWLLQTDFTAVVDADDPGTAYIPDHSGFGFGKVIGTDAAKVRPFILGGLDVKTGDAFKAGPKIAGGAWIPLQNTTVFAFGPQVSYIFSTHEVNYSLIAKLVFKIGPSTTSGDMGAGGETPRGMFSAQ